MENLQGAIRRICIFIMLFITVLCGNIYAQTPVKGHVTLKIEHKDLTLQEAQQHINQKTPVYLTVSLILKDGWVDYFDKKTFVGLGASSFSYAIVTTNGTKDSDAPFDKNPKAWMISGKEGCTAVGDGRSLYIDDVPDGYPMYYSLPLWNDGGCPTYSYGLGFNMSASMPASGYTRSGIDENGDKYYEVDLFPIAFYLKEVSTIYVRGVDAVGSHKTDEDTPEMRDNGASSGTTEINFIDSRGRAFTMDGEDGDWTFGSSARYGGIIPGGIFIEQSPEVAQFEPCQKRQAV